MDDQPTNYLDYAGSPSGTIETTLLLAVLVIFTAFLLWSVITKWDDDGD